MNSPGRDPFIGRTLDGRYRVRARIARGGMGMVYLADDLRLGRKVAVKAMHAHLVDDENFLRRFEKEAHAAARLNDQNVVNVFDQGFDADVPYLVMEYVPGITLRDLLKQQKRLTGAQVLEISEAVLKGLAAAHRAGFIHRDLKPENIFLADDGRIKIGDFGLARAANNNTTTGQALLGTIAYLSPELVTRGIADARSDVYAFGIMLYEMLTGVQPFRGEQAVQVAYMHANEDVPKPSLISRESTPELDEMVRWTTLRDPEKRPKDATVVLARLNQLLNGGLEAATKVMPPGANDITAPLARTAVLGAAEGSANLPAPAAGAGAHTADFTAEAHQSNSFNGADQQPLLPLLEKAQNAAALRRKRGLIIAALVAAATLTTATTAWWFNQGPGAQVTVPQLQGLTAAEANAALTASGLVPLHKEDCSSADVPVGFVVRSTPDTGARVDPQTAVNFCVSSGPALLEIPAVYGVNLDTAQRLLKDAGFNYQGVAKEVFNPIDAGTVLAVLDADGNELTGTYPEKSKLWLLVSAGALPPVTGLSVTDADSLLKTSGLEFDESLNSEAFSDDVPQGRVIELRLQADTVFRGDRVGLLISSGPELVTVPELVGLRMNEAIAKLEELGLTAETGVPGILRNAVRVSEISPAAGERVKPGTAIKLGFEL